jgi:hypothetical protein
MIIGGLFLFNCTVPVAQVPQSYANPFPEGSLIRLHGQDAIYVIQDGRKHHIPDADTFNALGFAWDQVRDVDRHTFNNVPTGRPIDPVGAPFSRLEEGSLIRLHGQDAIYVIQDGRKHHIPDAVTFNALGFNWNQVRDVDRQTFNSVPTGRDIDPVGIAEGSLIRLHGQDAIYVIQDGRKHHIPDAVTFNALGFAWDQVRDVDRHTFDSVPTGRPIPRR